MKLNRRAAWACLILCIFSFAFAAHTKETLVYVGTYTNAKSKGIYAFRMDDSGRLSPAGLVAETPSPSFLAIHPNKKFLYAANETDSFAGKDKTGGVTAFAIDRTTGKLKPINQQASEGMGPCHISVDESGKVVLVANYGSGSIAAYPIDKDGSLGKPSAVIQHQGSSVNKQRQAGPHAHFIAPDPSNKYVLACDLGLDKILIYRLDPKSGSLTANEPAFGKVKSGSGPRHLAFHPSGKFAFVNNEISSTVTAFRFEKRDGSLSEINTWSTLPKDFSGNNSTAEIAVHPSGKFVYVSNRGHNSVAVFAIDQKTGDLASVEHESTQGKTPRNFAIHPKGEFLLAENQGSDSIVIFRIDPKTGALSPTGPTAEAPSPVCVQFVEAQ